PSTSASCWASISSWRTGSRGGTAERARSSPGRSWPRRSASSWSRRGVSRGLFAVGSEFVDRVGGNAESFSNPGAGSLLASLSFHATHTLAIGLGEPVLALALWGLVPAWRRGTSGRFLVLALASLLPTLFLTSMWPVRYG